MRNLSNGSAFGLVEMLRRYGMGAGYAEGQRGDGDGTPIVPAERVGG
jgi:hypothetical protein